MNRFDAINKYDELDATLRETKGDWQPEDANAERRWLHAMAMANAALALIWRHDVLNQGRMDEPATGELATVYELSVIGLRILEGN